MNKKILSLIIAVCLIASMLSGCGLTVKTNDATKVPLTPALTQQEVLDYYAKALDYDTVVSRNVEPHVNNYVTSPVTNKEALERINLMLNTTEAYLGLDNYIETDESSRYLKESMYHYIRAMLNDKTLTRVEVVSAEQALGYYFVDVTYAISPSAVGTFKPSISLVGINGAYHYYETKNKDLVDEAFMTHATKALNEYYALNRIDLVTKYDPDVPEFKIGTAEEMTEEEYDFSGTTMEEPIIAEEPVSTEGSENTGTGEAGENGEPGEIEEVDISALVGIPEEEDKEEDNIVKPNTNGGIEPRKSVVDLSLFARVVGYGTYTAYVPELSEIYNIPESAKDGANEGVINGIGLYPSGAFGMTNFGFNRNNLTGTCTLRYVFKEDLVNPDRLSCTNIYVKYYEITTGFNANFDSLIPNFLMEQFKTIVERADRVITNQDITGLMKGSVFNDIGMAILTGYSATSGNVLRQISSLRRIISRNIANNSYLVEIESYRQEGNKDADIYATYKDTIYAVIEQEGSEFIITDWITMNRQLFVEPDIDPDAATAKRIVSLGLTSEPTEETKNAAEKLLDELYTASSYRILYGPQQLDDGTTIERGMYDCFDSNVGMLSSTKKEEINNTLRKLLIKYGTTTGATMDGVITSWIGGSTNQNQVEFTTEEVIQYQGRSSGIYMNCYYLMSCMEDVWVIDDIQILGNGPEELTGEGLASVVHRITGK